MYPMKNQKNGNQSFFIKNKELLIGLIIFLIGISICIFGYIILFKDKKQEVIPKPFKPRQEVDSDEKPVEDDDTQYPTSYILLTHNQNDETEENLFSAVQSNLYTISSYLLSRGKGMVMYFKSKKKQTEVEKKVCERLSKLCLELKIDSESDTFKNKIINIKKDFDNNLEEYEAEVTNVILDTDLVFPPPLEIKNHWCYNIWYTRAKHTFPSDLKMQLKYVRDTCPLMHPDIVPDDFCSEEKTFFYFNRKQSEQFFDIKINPFSTFFQKSLKIYSERPENAQKTQEEILNCYYKLVKHYNAKGQCIFLPINKILSHPCYKTCEKYIQQTYGLRIIRSNIDYVISATKSFCRLTCQNYQNDDFFVWKYIYYPEAPELEDVHSVSDQFCLTMFNYFIKYNPDQIKSIKEKLNLSPDDPILQMCFLNKMLEKQKRPYYTISDTVDNEDISFKKFLRKEGRLYLNNQEKIHYMMFNCEDLDIISRWELFLDSQADFESILEKVYKFKKENANLFPFENVVE
ncbi:hypothetical protein NUSPORA_00467 [Nucleospora cyclopteri]